MDLSRSTKVWKLQVLCLFSVWTLISSNLRYKVIEESEPGTFVGNVAQDLGLNKEIIANRGLRLGSEQSKDYFSLILESGVLILRKMIDRERLCGLRLNCPIMVKIVVEKPLELFQVEVEILDKNDNVPVFPSTERIIKITELATIGTRFPLERAQDPDVGNNSVTSYKLEGDAVGYFSLFLQNRKDDRPFPILVLEKTLDREQQEHHRLVLTAFDGGNPTRSGRLMIFITVVDINDNAPTFDKTVYKVSLKEAVWFNTLVINLNATDMDEGTNGEISYYFEDQLSETFTNIFLLDQKTGEIRVKGNVDYEECSSYEVSIKAVDHGVPEMEGHCVIQVEIQDINDNAPDILVSSLVTSIPEDTPTGTTVGLLSVSDKDTGRNGEVRLFISPKIPFSIMLIQNHYALIIDGFLDREQTSQYMIELMAEDSGTPQLHTKMTFYIKVIDINDNSPIFEHPFITISIEENNKVGSPLGTVHAFDKDEGENAKITYSIYNDLTAGSPVQHYIYLDLVNGDFYAQQSFDYEKIQVLEFTIMAEDSGPIKLFSNTTVYLYILDKNDNSPLILYPGKSSDGLSQQRIPKYPSPGSLVSKVIAVDADSGHNAYLSYSIVKATDISLFKIAQHSGVIKLARDFQNTDLHLQRLHILVEDHGEPPLSSTAVLVFSFEDNALKESPNSKSQLANSKLDITTYLVISIAAVSVVSVITFIVVLMKCLKKESRMDESGCCFLRESRTTQYLGHTCKAVHMNTDGTLRYVEVSMASASQQNHLYKTCSSDNRKNTLNFMKSMNFPQLKELYNGVDTLSGDLKKDTKQAQPNTDWRFSQAQRPGPSGAQPTEESGVWPNNQLETERLQAMILASANEAAEGTSALGGGNGTMGLSARYGPQFTLQHVPDYRQNIYIPGTTTTLTNAAGKREGKAAAPSGGNKKKSGKKEKK
uniref:Cadherin domain-containing protein n=1 Tax=Leptobrachium leishanense TaxID=445787 RepID=A0A8C5MIL9_9ANUR